MDASTLKQELAEAASSDDPPGRYNAISQALIAAGADLSAVQPILEFMEEHPDADLGVPGPLVHFVERFWRKGYEDLLLHSVQRRPTAHTVWMVHRLFNGAREEGERERYWVGILSAATHPQADADVRQRVDLYLERRR